MDNPENVQETAEQKDYYFYSKTSSSPLQERMGDSSYLY